MDKLSRNKLHLTAITSLIGSLSILTINPYLTNLNSGFLAKFSRFSSIFCSLSLSSLSLVCGSKLTKEDELTRAKNKSENDTNYHEIATTQYVNQKRLELIAQWELQKLQDELQPTYETNTEEVAEDLYSEELPLLTNTSETSDQLVDNELMEVVSKALSENKSDTFIIENILMMKGRKFKDGKQLLNHIKQQLEE